MRRWLRKPAGPVVLVAVAVLAVSLAALAAAGQKPSPQGSPVSEKELGALRRQVELLQSALAAETPEEAVRAWAKYVKLRNGAAQFALMSPELRAKERSRFEEANWVTGVSSPWVERFTVVSRGPAGDGKREYEVRFSLATSTGPAGTEAARLLVERREDRWCISRITR
ncbi:MAG TPA: hypothetical protein GXX28_06070 [Firmicutes bacterium]|nr:hypothetical protein [Bacillota bacterium]